MRIAPLTLTFALVACGVRTEHTGRYEAVNDSPYPLTVALSLSETSVEDNCGDGGDVKREHTLQPGTRHTEEASMTCSYEPSIDVSATIVRPDDAATPSGWQYVAGLQLGEGEELPATVTILTGKDQEPRELALEEGPSLDQNGLPPGVPTSEAFVADFEPFVSGVARFTRSSDSYVVISITSRERLRGIELGKRPFKARESRFGLSFAFTKHGREAKIQCTPRGCSVD